MTKGCRERPSRISSAEKNRLAPAFALYPFIFISNSSLALCISNGIALVLLFVAGYSFGRFTNGNPWRAGFVMVIFGVAIVALAIRLGG
jgi:VIT1/CCC1 family predicted Fe2+/Mn2+ transporter